MDTLTELYTVTLRNGKHLKVAKSVGGIVWGFPDRKGENVPVIISKYDNGKLVAKREVEYDFMFFTKPRYTWNALMREADLYESLGGIEGYIKHYGIMPELRRSA